jgi:hypothetical protein
MRGTGVVADCDQLADVGARSIRDCRNDDDLLHPMLAKFVFDFSKCFHVLCGPDTCGVRLDDNCQPIIVDRVSLGQNVKTQSGFDTAGV